MLRSTQTSSTRPCRLRFVNNSEHPVDVSWITYEGTEQSYASVPPNSQHVQATFTTHPWTVRSSNSKDLLGHYVGDNAVLEAFSCVPEVAVSEAAYALLCMLADTPPSIITRLAENDADIAIIGRSQVVSDMPPHSHLRGQSCAVGDRTFDKGTRGVGGNLGCPTCSVGEENVTMLDDKHYNQENILIHEFAHSVMCIGMDDEQRKSICAAYQEAAHSGLYQMHIYMMANADEYWAEATQSWFDATIRTDVNEGYNTREKIKSHDPLLATLLMHAYGDSPWRYTHTMPRDWGGKPRLFLLANLR